MDLFIKKEINLDELLNFGFKKRKLYNKEYRYELEDGYCKIIVYSDTREFYLSVDINNVDKFKEYIYPDLDIIYKFCKLGWLESEEDL